MNEERLENSQEKIPDKDVSGKNGFLEKLSLTFSSVGLCSLKIFSALLLGIIKGAKFIGKEFLNLFRFVFSGIKHILKAAVSPFSRRMKLTFQMQKALRRAKKSGKKEYAREIIRCSGIYLFGEEGVFYTAFNYILPIVSAAFLIGVVRYGSGLEYGICVECNGEEIGIISAEADFEKASEEVQQRLSVTEGSEEITLSSNLSLRIVSDSESFVSSEQLADRMLAASDHELTEAYGIYIDGNFIGAVEDKLPVQEALVDLILQYQADENIRDVSFSNTIEYSDGTYLADSVMTEEDAIALLTSTKQTTSEYVVQEDESPLIICMKHGMELEDFLELNPTVRNTCKAGQIVTITETERYLPIQYVCEVETVSLIDFDSVDVETSSLNVGETAVLVKGEKGERRSTVEVTYVDGVERSRKTVSSEITKEPVTEQIGVGTYSARPASVSTLLYGTGEFGWPVDGGYISDTFISNRNHKGLDIAADGGTDIYAAADGVVSAAGWNSGGYGYFVMIDHLNGYQTLYAHCSAVYAIAGQTVTRGQLIAAVGTTGDSTGNHCHFEVRYLGVCYDPTLYLNTVSYTEQ